jgi:hypothetical protein
MQQANKAQMLLERISATHTNKAPQSNLRHYQPRSFQAQTLAKRADNFV